MASATVQVESYRKPVDNPSSSVVEEARALEAAYRDAGLLTLREYAPAMARLASADALFEQMPPADEAIWRSYLPTSRKLWNYRYDVIPVGVARIIADTVGLQIFDRVEIWTPEGAGVMDQIRRFYRRAAQGLNTMLVASDPLAVGVISVGDTAYYYPIARWGEALHSFNRIKRTVMMRSMAVFAMTALPLMVLSLMLLGVWVWGFTALWSAAAGWAVPIYLSGTYAFILLFVLPIWRRRRR